MTKNQKNILKVTLSLALGIFIFWLAYRQMDIDQMKEILQGDVNYTYIWIAVAIGMISHLFRALRWRMLINALGEQKATVANTFFAVLIGYFANFLFPRAGEVVRCGIINQYHKIPLTKVIGTMIAERAFDVVILLLLIVVTFLMQMKLFTSFFDEHVSFSLSSYQLVLWVLGIILIIILLFQIFKNKIKDLIIYQKVVAMLKDILTGIKTSLKLDRPFWFFFHTIGIWGCYFLMLYIPAFAFDFTSNLSVGAIVFVFVMGSLGTVVPVQGGIGTFHIMVILCLGLFGVGNTEAGAFALIVHGAQMASYMVGGLFSMIALPLVNRKK